MISLIFPYGLKLARVINALDKEMDYEIIVAGSSHKSLEGKGIKFVKDVDLATTLIKCIEESKGEYIILLNDRVKDINKCISDLMERAKKGADIVIGKRAKKSRIAKMFVNLLFPKSRAVEDPLSEVFLIKREVVNKTRLYPVGCKILLEILAKGKYAKVEEIPVEVARGEGFNESYSNYSKHLLRVAWEEGEIFRFVKFGVVGGAAVILNEFILWLLMNKLHLLLAGFISIETSILFSFLLNEIWTFKDRGKRGAREFLKRAAKFNLATLVGLLINLSILLLLTSLAGIHPLKANIAGIAAAFIWNFFAHNLWTWYR